MSDQAARDGFAIDRNQLPDGYPTHGHSAVFWEELGRTVATFGFLEEVLGKAIFAFTGTREASDDCIELEYQKWLPMLERALSDQLGNLIKSYCDAVKKNGNANLTSMDDLLNDLRAASRLRNVLCHGSRRIPDAQGKSLPHFVNRHNEVFDTPIDATYLRQVRKHVVELACSVIDTVTRMGWQFPGSSGPGEPILRSRRSATS